MKNKEQQEWMIQDLIAALELLLILLPLPPKRKTQTKTKTTPYN